MIRLNDKKVEEIEEIFKKRSYQKFRAKQVFEAIHLNRINDFYKITNLPIKMREELKRDFKIDRVSILKTYESKKDSTKKYLLELEDKNIVEAVYMDYNDRSTICISSQVGCRMGCRFCASSKNGLVRNMTVSELIEEVYLLERINGSISNIVIMGIGEPLDNFDNIKRFIEIITDKRGRKLSHRSITLSTSGLAFKIRLLADSHLDVNLAVSLHYADDKKRKTYMPVAKKYSIKEIIDATDYYFLKTKRRVSFEYVVIDKINNLNEDVENLHKLLFGKNVHINLIGLNPIEEFDHARPTEKVVEEFKNRLKKRGLNATVRRSMGSDINASCGQLRNNYAR